MSYLLLKHFHGTCAVISFTLFFLRGIWSFNGSAIMRQRWTKVIPHVVDTLLLASALTLAFTIGQYPFVDAWLTAKVIGLIMYIGLGLVALNTPGAKPRVLPHGWRHWRYLSISYWLPSPTILCRSLISALS